MHLSVYHKLASKTLLFLLLFLLFWCDWVSKFFEGAEAPFRSGAEVGIWLKWAA